MGRVQSTTFSVSLENAFLTSGVGFTGKLRPTDRALHIHSVKYIKQCESHAFCRIPALDQPPLGIMASLKSIRPTASSPFCASLLLRADSLTADPRKVGYLRWLKISTRSIVFCIILNFEFMQSYMIPFSDLTCFEKLLEHD